jgi:hypothetical protein
MPHITVTDTELVVDLSKLEQLASLTKSLSIPRGDITSARIDPEILKHLGFRAPGTGMPGVIAAGTFYKQGDRQFVYWHKGETPIVVELAHEKYDRLIIGLDPEVAESVISQLNAG